MKYSFDTSAIIHAWNRAYPPDIFPVFWERMAEAIENQILIASDEVLVELEAKDDIIYKWAKKYPMMFIPIDEKIQKAVKEILRDHKKLLDTRKSRSSADPFVVATAKVLGCAVVTQENPTGKLHRPNIPDVCRSLRLQSMDLLQFIRTQNWVFK